MESGLGPILNELAQFAMTKYREIWPRFSRLLEEAGGDPRKAWETDPDLYTAMHIYERLLHEIYHLTAEEMLDLREKLISPVEENPLE